MNTFFTEIQTTTEAFDLAYIIDPDNMAQVFKRIVLVCDSHGVPWASHHLDDSDERIKNQIDVWKEITVRALGRDLL